MNMDERLHEAGQRWRESQGPALQPPALGRPAENGPPRRWGKTLAPVAAAAAAAGIAVGIVNLYGTTTTNQVPSGSTGTTSSPVPSASPSPVPSSPDVLWPADNAVPAAGICGGESGAVVTVTANLGGPGPRCLSVTSNQRLRVVNGSNADGQPGRPITITFAGFAPRVVPAGGATLFDQALGEYLAPGVHSINISLYAGSAEIWLKPVGS